MAETRSRSLRIEDGLWERFCALPGTQNDAFRRLLDGEAEPGLVQKLYERAGRIENMVEELLELGVSVGATTHVPVSSSAPSVLLAAVGVDPASIPGVSVGVPPKKAVVIKRYKCEHCGASPAVPRVGEICEKCRENGHRDDIRNCPECWNPA